MTCLAIVHCRPTKTDSQLMTPTPAPRRLAFTLLVSALLLSGCVTTESNRKAYDSLAPKSPCCADLSTIPTQPIAEGQSISFSISESSPVFAFPENKSYFAAFQLPQTPDKYTLTLRSVYAYAPSTSTQPIFHPTLLFLDENRVVVRKIGQERFHYARASMFQGPGLELSVAIDERAKKPHFVVIYSELTSPDAGRPLPVPQSGGAYMVGNVVVPTYSGGGTAKSEPTPTGELHLSIKR